MEIDYNLKTALSSWENKKIAEYSAAWQLAYESGDRYGMQAAHDAANAIRLRILDSVQRVDFINGGYSTIFKTSTGGLINSNSGLVVESYVKGQIGISMVGTANLQAKLQGGELAISFTKGLNGQLGAQLTASAGLSINSGEIEHSIKRGESIGALYFIEGELTLDVQDGDFEAIIGGGIGYAKSIPILPNIAGYEHEIKLLEIRVGEPRYPMTYAEWMHHLSK